MNKKTVANLVESLVKKGYVERVTVSGRYKGIRLTAKGRAVAQAGELDLAGLEAFVVDGGLLAKVRVQRKPGDN